VAAERIMGEIGAAKIYRDPIVTELAPASKFYLAENYHQEYFARNANQPYCQFIVAPKVARFRKQFTERLKKA
jgi:peptide-methionine (S)-S-oxide reductase